MKEKDTLIITKTDFEKISVLTSLAKRETAELLKDELARATIVHDEQLPEDVVAMNSIVSFEDMDTGKTTVITLVYPPDANIDANKISILSPVGSALIGLRVGQTINWRFPNGKEKILKVISVKPNLG